MIDVTSRSRCANIKYSESAWKWAGSATALTDKVKKISQQLASIKHRIQDICPETEMSKIGGSGKPGLKGV